MLSQLLAGRHKTADISVGLLGVRGSAIIAFMVSGDGKGELSRADSPYQEALDYIYSFIDYEREPTRPREPARYDLRRVEELLARLGNPHLKTKTVHIAGTKGKGSVAAMIASALTASGYTTGLYTSPHLHTFNERIRVDDRLISNEELVALVEKLKPEVEAVNAKATYGRLTTFELITALGFAYFEQKGVDFQVIEVGLGGRLDATNVVQPEVVVITSISFDHMDVLGNTLTEIATEKAGIIKPNSTVVTSPQVEEVSQVLAQTGLQRQAKQVRVGSDVTWQSLGFDASQQALRVKGRLGSYELSIPLLGQHQLENTATAVAVLEVLIEKGFHISRDSIASGLARVKWPGRLQVLSRHPLLVVDGAHNPYSAGKLREALQQYFDFDRAILVIGTSSDKDITGIVSELIPMFDKVIVTHSIHPRAMPTAAVTDEFRRQGVEAEATDDIAIALPLALTLAGGKDLICVTGSLFVVAGAIEQAEALGLTPY
ncbi:MAG: bifunctional folylpolyglutamate synthase/dihydrofolate synthase [Chloroflexi bacterium]|nr:bifunctional folylpolyglutamate synthase/dihydrofolate synthase [Chloroflexota bacterium]